MWFSAGSALFYTLGKGWAGPHNFSRQSTLSEHAQLIFNHSNMANFRKAAVKIAQKKYEDCDSDLSDLGSEADFSGAG